ncbi:DUF1638 domain-containing protein [Methanolapillus millepedarum]|uniref:DUF1638 domain-containing protein n=1 Tax=Methanolapillus millepedarum TaxID=3028296 RepID=A0AA96ZV03_9EURY|nr:hypothetical protein MsAc7_04200 [Methanosarcinaceae archaeon Ac7]
MTTMGILACKMLQDEIVYLIQQNPDIETVYVVTNGEHIEFVHKLRDCNIDFKPVSHISELPDVDSSSNSEGLSLVVWQLELGLHETPKRLKVEVYDRLSEFSKKADGILLFYGLCGNVLGNVEDDFKDICPIVILRDRDGNIADDCIGATLGSRKTYANLLKSFGGVGTFIFTPMYEATIDEFFQYKRMSAAQKLSEEQIIEMNKFMFEASNYKRIARLDTGLTYTGDTLDNVKRFAEMYHFEIFEMDGGNQEVFENCFLKLKCMLVKA